ncbi:MAG: hypothetical protein AAGB32_06000 [Pseudomonadota bacterium]
MSITRRGFIGSGAAAVLATTFGTPATAHEEGSDQSLGQLGKDFIEHTGSILFNDADPEDLRSTLSLDNWTPETVATAMEQAWTHMVASEELGVFKEQGVEGNQFERFTTDTGHTAQSATQSIAEMMRNARDTLQDIINRGTTRNAYRSVYDRGIQASLLNILSHRETAVAYADSLSGSAGEEYLSNYDQELQTVSEEGFVRFETAWEQGFELFVEQTLVPYINNGAAPQATAPPPAPTSILD